MKYKITLGSLWNYIDIKIKFMGDLGKHFDFRTSSYDARLEESYRLYEDSDSFPMISKELKKKIHEQTYRPLNRQFIANVWFPIILPITKEWRDRHHDEVLKDNSRMLERIWYDNRKNISKLSENPPDSQLHMIKFPTKQTKKIPPKETMDLLKQVAKKAK